MDGNKFSPVIGKSGTLSPRVNSVTHTSNGDIHCSPYLGWLVVAPLSEATISVHLQSHCRDGDVITRVGGGRLGKLRWIEGGGPPWAREEGFEFPRVSD